MPLPPDKHALAARRTIAHVSVSQIQSPFLTYGKGQGCRCEEVVFPLSGGGAPDVLALAPMRPGIEPK